MDNELIIERNKAISIKNMLFCLLGILLFILFLIIPVNKLADSESNKNSLIVFKVLVCLCIPFLILSLITYLKNLLSKEPVLVINEQGITDNTNLFNKIGPILWEDILFIKVVPYMNNLVYICLKLKEPAKYVKHKPLSKFNNLKSFLDVNIYSMYFKGKEQLVIDMINMYLENKKNIS